MQKSDEKEPATMPYQAYLFNTAHISEALGTKVLSISDISAKVNSNRLSADITAVCKSKYSSLLTVTKEENIMRIDAKAGHQFIQLSYAIDGENCKVVAITKPVNSAITASRGL